MFSETWAHAGFDVSGGLPEGFSGALPAGFSGVLPPLSPGDDPEAPVYVVPVQPSPRAQRTKLWQRGAAAWRSLRCKMGLQKQEDCGELAGVVAAPIPTREEAVARLNMPQQQQRQSPPDAEERSAFGVHCACF